MKKEIRTVCNMMADAYIKVYGIEKWNSLTGKQQRDIIMHLVKVTHKAIDIIDEMPA